MRETAQIEKSARTIK
jgi:hypothetical protein